MAEIRETDLYGPVKSFLEALGYTVRGEVGACDLVARRGDEAPVIVELKCRFSLALVYQGIDRQQLSDSVYLAVAAPEGRAARAAWAREAAARQRLCRLLGLGLMLVTPAASGKPGAVEPLLDPGPYRPRLSRVRQARLLREFSGRAADHNVGGSRGRKLVTAYREDALRCADRLAAGALKLAELRRLTGVARAAAIVRRNVYGWFERIGYATYGLTAEGHAALVRFAAVVELLRTPDAVTVAPAA